MDEAAGNNTVKPDLGNQSDYPLIDTVRNPTIGGTVDSDGENGQTGDGSVSQSDSIESAADSESTTSDDTPNLESIDDEDEDSTEPESQVDSVDSETMSPNTTDTTTRTTASEETVTYEIDPVIRALAIREVTEQDIEMATLVTNAVDSYLSAILRGEEPWTHYQEACDERSLSVDADPALTQLLTDAAAASDTDGISEFILSTLSDALSVDLDETTVSVRKLSSTTSFVEAITQNDDCPHETREDVIQAALRSVLLQSPNAED